MSGYIYRYRVRAERDANDHNWNIVDKQPTSALEAAENAEAVRKYVKEHFFTQKVELVSIELFPEAYKP